MSAIMIMSCRKREDVHRQKEICRRTGDTVIVKQQKENKLTPTFAAESYRVTEKIGNSVTLNESVNLQNRRNTTHLKKLLERSNNNIEKLTYPDGRDYTEVGDWDDTSHQGNHKDIPEIVESATRPTRERKLPERFKDLQVSFK